MKVLISGASGLIGQFLCRTLKESGNEVISLVRDKNLESTDTIFWDPAHGKLQNEKLEGIDAAVNLSGENIAGKRWSEDRKKSILQSRIQSSKILVDALIGLDQPPKVLICSSAIGYYGNRSDEICTEETKSGKGFLAEVCRQWEATAHPAGANGIRTVLLRTGIVLSPDGGALAKMLPLFKLGLGGALGSGEQYMSWIAIDDLVGAIVFALSNENMKGPVNGTAPNPVKNAEFTSVLGKVLGRPTVLSVPAFALKLLLGKEMAEELLLCSTRALPEKLLQHGYTFKYPSLEEGLKKILQK